MHTVTPNASLIPESLKKHLSSKFATTLKISDVFKTYECHLFGGTCQRGGIHSALRKRFYSHYPRPDSKRRRRKTTKHKGSSKRLGKTIDNQIISIVATNTVPKRINKLTKALVDYWQEKGHTLIAAQVPVYVTSLDCVTQADCITRAKDGTCTMWEVKTGFPVGGYRIHGKFKSAPFQNLDCTQYNIWQLQRKYTHEALKEAGIELEDSRVIQVFEHTEKGIVIKEWPNNLYFKCGKPICSA